MGVGVAGGDEGKDGEHLKQDTAKPLVYAVVYAILAKPTYTQPIRNRTQKGLSENEKPAKRQQNRPIQRVFPVKTATCLW